MFVKAQLLSRQRAGLSPCTYDNDTPPPRVIHIFTLGRTASVLFWTRIFGCFRQNEPGRLESQWNTLAVANRDHKLRAFRLFNPQPTLLFHTTPAATGWLQWDLEWNVNCETEVQLLIILVSVHG